MDLDRSALARIDRKLLAGLGQDETYRMVRVPVTASKWSTWRRYCDSAGISMGRAIVALIDRELMAVFSDSAGDSSPVFAEQAEVELARRQEKVARRELDARAAEERLRAWNEHLRSREGELETREQRAELSATMSARTRETPTRVGRNERCPCGSKLKYKHCHGLAGWQRRTAAADVGPNLAQRFGMEDSRTRRIRTTDCADADARY